MKTCRLCCEPKEKLQESHIIPNAFWKKLKIKDSNKKNGAYISISECENKYDQVTYSEELLCSDCEQKFSNGFENYVAQLFLQNPAKIGVSVAASDKYRTFKGVDFNKLKLFQMSIIWRASISSIDFYSQVKLTSSEEERLRNSLYSLAPYEPWEYGCVMSSLLMNGDIKFTRSTKQFIVSPYAKTVGETQFIIFIFGGFEWGFTIPVCSQTVVNEKWVITKSGEVKFSLKDVHKDPVLFQMAVNAHKNEKEGRGTNAKSRVGLD